MKNPFCYFKTSHEIIRLAVMMYVRFPLSLRDVEDLLHEHGIDWSWRSRAIPQNQLVNEDSEGSRSQAIQTIR